MIAIGNLFTDGKISSARVVALTGPQAKTPRALRTRVGASVDDFVQGELKSGDNRLISGSVPVSFTLLRAHETPEHLVCRLLLVT